MASAWLLWVGLASGQDWSGTTDDNDNDTPSAGDDSEEPPEPDADSGEEADPAPSDAQPPEPTTELSEPPVEAPPPTVEVVPPPEADAPTAELPVFPIDEAEEAPGLSRDQLAWLKPRRSELEPNPYAQTDFTAYSLEWGEVKVGLASVTVGVLPRTQLGTSLPLDILGVPNANIKVNAVRTGPLDVGIVANRYQLSHGSFRSSTTGIGARASFIALDDWSFHATSHMNFIRATGLPDLRQLNGVLNTLSGDELDDFSIRAIENNVDLDLRARTVTLRLATDYRFNRRDSVVAEFQTMVWRSLDSNTGGNPDLIPPLLGMDQWLNEDVSGALPISDAYVASVAWQLAWKQAELRIGGGLSSIPFAWLLQSTEFSVRFGGPTRRGESRMRKTWRKNKSDVD